VYAALRAGASGFLLKDTGPERLLAAISTVAAGDMLFAPTVVGRLIEAYAQARDTTVADDLSELTARETEVLRLVARGLSNTDIAAQLVVSEATVKTHLNRVMTKLGLSSRAQAVVVAYETGLVVPGSADRDFR
jgi:DNA-binding NarL/FixJ family response regulator